MLIPLLTVSLVIIFSVGAVFLLLISTVDNAYEDVRRDQKREEEERKQRKIKSDFKFIKMAPYRLLSTCSYFNYDILKAIVTREITDSKWYRCDVKDDLVKHIRFINFVGQNQKDDTDHKRIRIQNPFILTDDEKLDLIKYHNVQSFIDILLYGFNQQPSEYLLREVKKMKLKYGPPEKDDHVEFEKTMQQLDIDKKSMEKIYKKVYFLNINDYVV